MGSSPDCAEALRAAVARAGPRLRALSEPLVSQKPAPGKWCAKEILGHLIDSATNNHPRFVEGPGKSDLVFPGYDQDVWAGVQRYERAPWTALVGLWEAFNVHLAYVMEAVPPDDRRAEHTEHNYDAIAWKAVPRGRAVTLEYLMDDYVRHLEHHLTQLAAATGQDI